MVGNHDSSLTAGGCELKAVVMDGFTRSNERTDDVDDGPNTLVAATSSPRENATFLQYNLIPFRGLIRSAGDVLPPGDHTWSVQGPGGFSRSGIGTIFDMGAGPGAGNLVQSGGWPVGSYTATLTKTGGSTDPSATDTVHFTVLADNDNDGIPAGRRRLPRRQRQRPADGDNDKDNDGLPNANDPQPCVAASSYNAIIDFNPDPFPTPSNGNTVTVSVRVPGRNVGQVAPEHGADHTLRRRGRLDEQRLQEHRLDRQRRSRHREVRPAEADRVAGPPRNIDDRFINVTVVGSSGTPAWSFEGYDTVFISD